MLWDNVFRMRNLRIFQQIWYLQIQLEQMMTKELKQASKKIVFIVTLTDWNALILPLVSYSLISAHVCSSCKWEEFCSSYCTKVIFWCLLFFQVSLFPFLFLSFPFFCLLDSSMSTEVQSPSWSSTHATDSGSQKERTVWLHCGKG